LVVATEHRWTEIFLAGLIYRAASGTKIVSADSFGFNDFLACRGPVRYASVQHRAENGTVISTEHDLAGDARHTRWSDPGRHADLLRSLPKEPKHLAEALEGFVVHIAIARAFGQAVPPEAEGDRLLRCASRMLDTARRRDASALTESRDLQSKLFGNCHEFALLAVSTLREKGVPARLRVGHASYLAPGLWEDHWVCQHWTGLQWATFDAQLGHRTRCRLNISFDVGDIPMGTWRSAASTWRAIRRGEIEPTRCGVSFAGVSGDWLVASAVLHDAAALAGIETIPGDAWGPALAFGRARRVTEDQARNIDALSEALDPAPTTRAGAMAVLDRFPWARPTPTISNFISGLKLQVQLEDF
jgi:Transglutaminase-like superfamily